MKRLIERGLMFGNLVEVATPTLVARYNTALDKLIGKRTALTEFHIDLSGFSPEIGDEFDDTLYLNASGCNRQFIILGLDQMRSPLLNAQFSTTRSILRKFMDDNAGALSSLTAREAVLGEMINSVWRLSRPADVLELHTITVDANTVSGRVTEAEKLSRLIEVFRTEDEVWHDDEHIARMIELAEKVGDINNHPVAFKTTVYKQGNFHTTHFGGLYLFRDVDYPALLYRDPTVAEARIEGIERVALNSASDVGHFLLLNNLIEPIVEARDLDAKALLRQRQDFMMIEMLANVAMAPEELARLTRADLRRIAMRQGGEPPPEFELVGAALRALEEGRKPPTPRPLDPGFFYLHRAAPVADRELVNQLLTEFTALDIRQLYICNKPAFYAAYRGWSERKKDYVVEFLARDYAPDKDAVWNELFGREPSAPTPAPQIGPWGPFTKN